MFHHHINEKDYKLLATVFQCTVAIGFSCEDGEVRLAEANGVENAGIVEVCYGNRFGTVCDDGHWDAGESLVVCKQLDNNTDIGQSWIIHYLCT